MSDDDKKTERISVTVVRPKPIFIEVSHTITVGPLEDDDAPQVWRCYSCGSTDGFSEVVYQTGYGDEYDCECNKCGSVNTHADGEGSPDCECGEIGWFCYRCCKALCGECWKWFEVKEEPDENICPDCS